MRQCVSRIRGLALGHIAGVGAGLLLMSVAAPVADAQFVLHQVAATSAENPLLRPIYLTAPPGDYKRVFIIEKQGRIRVLDITNPAPILQQDTTPFLDIRSLIPTLAAGNTGNQDERGLLGLAFHPNYLNNGKFYVYYTALPVSGLPNSAAYYCTIVEYTNPTPLGNTANAGSARIIMQIPHPQQNHNGGCMNFGPDGYLYINVGDGGGQNDANVGHNSTIGNGQDTGTPLGKMMRIDINVTSTPAQGPFVPGSIASYGIPADNPTLVPPAGSTGNRSEIWAFGLRNPWRSSFDRLTGDLWIGNVGQNTWEEIEYQPALTAQNLSVVAGRNYGWRCFEGSVSFNTNSGSCSLNFDGPPNPPTAPALTGPIGMYSHNAPTAQPRAFSTISGTCSITGGYVYRGCRIPELYGSYIFTDYCSGRIWTTTLNASHLANEPTDWSGTGGVFSGSTVTTPTISPVTRPSQAFVSFGEDAYGEVYVLDQPNGRVHKFVRASTGAIVNANCDVNFDGVKSVQDIFDYLAAYFGSTGVGDFNRSGTYTVQDIFDFLACYFGPCTQ